MSFFISSGPFFLHISVIVVRGGALDLQKSKVTAACIIIYLVVKRGSQPERLRVDNYNIPAGYRLTTKAS